MPIRNRSILQFGKEYRDLIIKMLLFDSQQTVMPSTSFLIICPNNPLKKASTSPENFVPTIGLLGYL